MYTISRYVDIGLDKINYCKGNRADGNSSARQGKVMALYAY